QRLPVAKTGVTPFGTGLDREGVAAIRLDPGALLDYTAAVKDAVIAYVESLTDEQASEPIPLPFFKEPYGFDSLSRIEALAFFCVGHTAEHLGEVQMLRGLMGLKGALL
ncbi:MAG TPA: DinB family protein, partial [Dehalococcoidia bacterium]|nr:DinB family protein [Dehalococcoidia bacterium]